MLFRNINLNTFLDQIIINKIELFLCYSDKQYKCLLKWKYNISGVLILGLLN